MIWLIFALISAVCESTKSLLHRKVMITEDPYAYAMFENIFAALIFLIFISQFIFPNEIQAWLIVSFASILWLLISVLSQYSYKYTKVSIQEPLKQTRLLWVLLIGIIFLHELITLNKIIGTLFIFVGLIIISYQKKSNFGSFKDKGVQITLIYSFLFALVTIIDKYALNYFNAETYGFLVYLLPGIILLIMNRKSKHEEILNLIKKFWLAILIVAITSFGYYYFKLKALELADATLVFPIIRGATILTVLGGIILFNEKENLFKKLISIFIIFIGIVFLSI